MSFLSPPTPPDPSKLAAQQQQYNLQAGQAQSKLGMTGQTTPFGQLMWVPDPSSPSGYRAVSGLNPYETQTVGTLQGAGSDAARGVAGMYANPIDLSPEAMTKNLMGWQQQYIQPIFNQQESNLEADLRNKGLTPGSEAYNNAKNLQARNEGDITNQFFAQSEPLAFSQKQQEYQFPIDIVSRLMQGGHPPAPGFVPTPAPQVQPPNYMGAAEQQYQQQQQQYGQMMQGLFSIPTALAGGWAYGGGINKLFA